MGLASCAHMSRSHVTSVVQPSARSPNPCAHWIKQMELTLSFCSGTVRTADARLPRSPCLGTSPSKYVSVYCPMYNVSPGKSMSTVIAAAFLSGDRLVPVWDPRSVTRSVSGPASRRQCSRLTWLLSCPFERKSCRYPRPWARGSPLPTMISPSSLAYMTKLESSTWRTSRCFCPRLASMPLNAEEALKPGRYRAQREASTSTTGSKRVRSEFSSSMAS